MRIQASCTELIPYKYIAIEGNIGAGKSTLATFLYKCFGGRLLMEQFEENESLKEFYRNPSFALNAEIQFFKLYEPIAKRLLMEHPQPDLILYLNRTTDELLENIKRRGRDYELSMGEDYLDGINSGYENYLFEMTDCPIIEINAKEIDLKKPKQLEAAFQRIIGVEYAPTRRKVDLKTLVNYVADV